MDKNALVVGDFTSAGGVYAAAPDLTSSSISSLVQGPGVVALDGTPITAAAVPLDEFPNYSRQQDWDVALDTDGFFIFGQNYTLAVDPPPGRVLSRRELDGTRDTGFTPPAFAGDIDPSSGVYEGSILGVIPDGTGGCFVYGNFGTVGGVASAGFARLNPDGTRDSSWASPATNMPAGMAYAGGFIHLLADGVIYKFNASGPAAGYTSPSFVDTGFNPLRGLTVDSAGRIYLHNGSFTLDGYGATQFNIARFLATGAVDPGWAPTNSFTATKVMEADAGVVYVVQSNGSTARVNASGSMVTWPALYPSGVDMGQAIVDASDGSVFGLAQISGQTSHIVRFLADGSTDPVFPWNSTGAQVPVVREGGTNSDLIVAKGPGARMLVAGRLRTVAGRAMGCVVAFGMDGEVDTEWRGGVVGSVSGVHVGAAGILIKEAVAVGAVPRNQAAVIVEGNGVESDYAPSPYINPSATSSQVREQLGCGLLRDDGFTYLGGRFASFGGPVVLDGESGYAIDSLARTLPDGTADEGFANPAIVDNTSPPAPQTEFPGVVSKIALAANGDIIAVGDFDLAGRIYQKKHLVRVTPAGEVVGPFHQELSHPGHAVAVRADGKVWVGGRFTSVVSVPLDPSIPYAGLILVNDDGSLDTSFANPLINTNGTSRYVSSIVPLPDGKVLIAGTFTQINSVTVRRCVRLNADGTVDSGFLCAVTGNLGVAALSAAGDRLYVGGSGGMFRLNLDGSADTSFTNPFPSNATIHDIKPMADGTVVVVGKFYLDGHISVVQLDAAGAVVPEFSNTPLLVGTTNALPEIFTVSLADPAPLAMVPLHPRSRIYQGKAASILYRTFGGEKPYSHQTVGKLPDGWASSGDLVGGSASEAGTFYWSVKVTDAAGAIATTLTRAKVYPASPVANLLAFANGVNRIAFNGSSQVTVLSANGAVEGARRLADGRIVAWGAFTTFGGQTRRGIAVLAPAGTLDMSFVGPANAGDIPATKINDVAQLSTGKFVVGWEKTTATQSGGVTRLNADGTLDGSYSFDARASRIAVKRLLVRPDDSLVLGAVVVLASGASSWWNSTLVFRVDATGAIDEEFLDSFPKWPSDIWDLPEDALDGTLRMLTIRGGTIPSTNYFWLGVYDIALDEDGHYVAVGSFVNEHLGGVRSESAVRIFHDGGVDEAWASHMARAMNNRGIVRRVFPQGDGTYVVVGDFDRWKVAGATITGSGYAHIKSDGSPATLPDSWSGTALPATNSHATGLDDGRIITRSQVSSVWQNIRIFPDGAADLSFSTPATVANVFLPDDNGVDGFSADGSVSIDAEAAEGEGEDVFTADGSIMFVAAQEAAEITVVVAEALAMGDGVAPLPISVSREAPVLGGANRATYEGTAAVADAAALGDSPAFIIFKIVEETVVLGADGTPDFTALVRVAERLLLEGRASHYAEAVGLVTDALVLRALSDAYHAGVAVDTLLMADHVASVYSQVAAVIERALLSGSAAPSYTAMVVVREEVVVAGTGTPSELEISALIRESVGFAANLTFDNGEYIAWVMNTESKGLSRYTQYPFNSFARIGGRYMGCAPTGLFWLDGDTDEGEPIAARVRLGLSALGTRRLKRIPECFIGYTSSGVLLLKAIVVDEDTGERNAAHFRLRPRPATSLRENRFTLGRGLKAVDWDFEIENIDGADFELASVEFRPLLLDRRTRG